MSLTALLPELGRTLQGVFTLQGGAFAQAASMSQTAILVGLLIVLLAGFSEAVGESIVLFANRVKAARFFFSWLIQALLFAFGYAVLVSITWSICRIPGAPHLPFAELALVFALSYAPLCFAFLGALPYLGSGVFTVLRVWHLLAMVVGFSAIASVGFAVAAGYVAFGWTLMMLAARSFGKPIAVFGTRISDAVAGVRLVDDEQRLVGRSVSAKMRESAGTKVTAAKRQPRHPNVWKVALGLAGVALLALVVALSLSAMRDLFFGWTKHLPLLARLPFTLLWLGLFALLVSALMAPLETLGWWAGWYGDRIDTAGEATSTRTKGKDGAHPPVKRYVIYLDGIAQSSSRYTPDIETFLDALSPELPAGTCLLRGVMAYSVMNRPLDDDPLWSRFWQFIDRLRFKNVDSILGMVVNLRNVLIVAVSSDPRYGPMYNFGIAQVMYRSLIHHGYRLGSKTPVTLIGYSGGGQMACASAHFLKRAIGAPIDVISLGGVIDGDDPVLDLRRLYHLVGDKDNVERIGPVMFASRWPLAVLSPWNRAKRLGVLLEISLGPVGHQVPGGMLDPKATLPDGRTNLRQTLDYITSILSGRLVVKNAREKPNWYELAQIRFLRWLRRFRRPPVQARRTNRPSRSPPRR